MPARKPNALITRNDTKADKRNRAAAESAFTPKTELSMKPPKVLNGHKVAKETWERVVGLYNEIEGKIATGFDADVLVKYCLLEEEVVGMARLRDGVLKDYEAQRRVANKIKDVGERSKLFEIVNALLARYQGMDARLDGKRKLLHSLAQSLYLTPRSRAGVEPPTKDDPTPKSEMEGLL
jgi:hypothetical protein